VLGPPGLLVEVLERVLDDLAYPFRREERTFGVDGGDLFVGNAFRQLDGVDVVDPERQHVLVRNRIDDAVGVQPLAEGLLRGLPQRVSAATGVDREDRRAGEAKEVIALERPRDRPVHVAELRPVALVEDDYDVAVVDRVPLVRRDEGRKLLDRRDNDLCARILELLLEDASRGVRVRGALLEAVVLTHRLVVEVLAIDHKQHLVDVGQP